MKWFDVDREGLRALLAGKSPAFIVRELIQNAWDEPGVTECRVEVERIPGTRNVRVTVEDDAPEGFYDLRHAYTLFAETRKRPDPEKRGRFNFGEKQVLALCREAEILTTTGGVAFLANGTRKGLRRKRDKGSVFSGVLKMTNEQMQECEGLAYRLLPPPGIGTWYNGHRIPSRKPLKVIEARLATILEREGALSQTVRQTIIELHEPREGEVPMLYEMGLPVVETGDKYHYNVRQRVPLTVDRDNVSPAFLRDVRAEVANAMHQELTPGDASEPWVRDASSDERIEPEAVQAIATARWGERRVVADPNDPLSRGRALEAGYKVVGGSELSRDEWENMRAADAIPSSSSLFPSKLGAWGVVEPDQWTGEQRFVAMLTEDLGHRVLGFHVTARVGRSKNGPAATYGDRTVMFNLDKLPDRWWRPGNRRQQLELIIHELGHEQGDGHKDADYIQNLCRIGAALALMRPECFEPVKECIT